LGFGRRCFGLCTVDSRLRDSPARTRLDRGSRYAEIAAEFVRLNVNVIVTVGSAVPTVKQATTAIPIVFAVAIDPVSSGLVASLAKPGGNVTGVTNFVSVLAAKQFELLHELVPNASLIGVLVNPTDLLTKYIARDVQAAQSPSRRNSVLPCWVDAILSQINRFVKGWEN
jgi:putative ABC transport system substrate-binding protein